MSWLFLSAASKSCAPRKCVSRWWKRWVMWSKVYLADGPSSPNCIQWISQMSRLLRQSFLLIRVKSYRLALDGSLTLRRLLERGKPSCRSATWTILAPKLMSHWLSTTTSSFSSIWYRLCQVRFSRPSWRERPLKSSFKILKVAPKLPKSLETGLLRCHLTKSMKMATS